MQPSLKHLKSLHVNMLQKFRKRSICQPIPQQFFNQRLFTLNFFLREVNFYQLHSDIQWLDI